MPFVPREELQALHDQNASMREQLEDWQRMAPFLELGKELQTELVAALGSSAMTGVSVTEIGETAYQNVKQKKEEEARDRLTSEYEQTHRKALYERVVKEVEQEQGENILQGVFERLESDAKLATELRDSARKELTARAHDVVLSHVTKEQQAVIEAETDRQMALDRFDVRFALEGELFLHDVELLEKLRPNDKLVIMFAKHHQGQAGISFTWAEDIDGTVGWVFNDAIMPKRNTHYSAVIPAVNTIPKDRFVQIGSEVPNLSNGTKGVKHDVLSCKRPIVVSWTDAKGKAQNYTVQEQVVRDSYARNNAEAIVSATDFQTRDIEFVNNKQK